MKMKRLLFAAATVLALSSCSVTLESPQQKVYAAHGVYDTALTVALAYKQLPECAPGGPIICSDKEVVTTVQRVDRATYEGLMSAQAVVRSDTTTATAKETAVIWAQEAANAFKKVVAVLKTN